MRLIRSTLDLESRVQIMGVLNVTPDSFSDGGLFAEIERAVERAFEIARQGADILDIGGESTRPSSQPVSEADELSRVAPVLERLGKGFPIPISIDTTKASVARAAVALGAEIINDISGLRFDPTLADIAAETGAGLVLMHSRGTPETMQQLPPAEDILATVTSGLRISIETALARGVPREKLIVDPGIGFGKTAEQNLQLIGNLDRLSGELGLPVLLGPSRKAFIKRTLDQDFAGRTVDLARERVAGTAASVAIGILRGARIVRVHDVDEMAVVVRMAEAIVRAG